LLKLKVLFLHPQVNLDKALASMNKQEHPDILGELFQRETERDPIAGLEGLEELIHACKNPQGPASHRPQKLLPLPQKRSLTRKTTHYLREDIFQGLDQAKESLQRLLPEGAKLRASKSNLVNVALRALLQDIEEKGLESPVVSKILKVKKK